MTPNPNENQAEKHSAEPWSVIKQSNVFALEYSLTGPGMPQGGYVFGPEFRFLRLAACAAFCADVPTILLNISSSSTPLKDLLEDEVKMNAELSTLRKELEEIKARTAIQAIERLVTTCCSQCDHDTTEDRCANCLKLQVEGAKKYAGEVLNEMRAYCGEGEFDETDPMKTSFDCLKRITGELLNNGKDGK